MHYTVLIVHRGTAANRLNRLTSQKACSQRSRITIADKQKKLRNTGTNYNQEEQSKVTTAITIVS